MNKREINKVFKKFHIKDEELPQYSDPYTFTKNFKKCSVLEIEEVTYSSNSSIEEIEEREK